MSDADCTPGREPRSVAASVVLKTVFGRPFVKRFALCCQTVVCLSVCMSVYVSVCLSVRSVLSVTFVHCAQTVGRIKVKLGMSVGLVPGHIVFAGDPAFPTDNGTTALHFSIHVYCGQTAGWIKMALGTEVGLGPGDIEFRWRPNYPHGKEHNSPQFSVHVYCGQTVAHLSYC